MPSPVLVTQDAHPYLTFAPVPVVRLNYSQVAGFAAEHDVKVAVIDDPKRRDFLELALSDVPTLVALTDEGGVTSFRLDYLISPYGAGRNHAKRVLSGLEYAPLRSYYASLRKKRLAFGKARRIMVCLGGSSAAMGLVPELAADVRSTGCQVVVYGGTGPMPHFGQHHHVTDQREAAYLMRGTDLAISTASMTALELLCMGVPTLTVAVAPNQVAAQSLLGAYAPPYNLDTLLAMVGDTPVRERLSGASWATVDGKGAERVAKAILGG